MKQLLALSKIPSYQLFENVKEAFRTITLTDIDFNLCGEEATVPISIDLICSRKGHGSQ